MSDGKPRLRRCAVYTRKSSEEGLEQAFNSLHAQREACEAFIKSQHSEGWRLVPAAYDDGGLSGGSMERPALQRLLADIDQGLIDIVVVYKVDRLTRSLMDFSKIVERLDRSGASFVAVTQQFNTTTSMGRLTLNILLSFAQFEREIAGERIRDKIAASKRKGMWMGGTVPLGYRVKERKLVVDEAEAATVRLLYERYRALGTIRLLQEELDRRGIRSKGRLLANGAPPGGVRFSRGALHTVLTNPIYIGEIRHKGSRYPGQHAPIIARPEWETVQQMLQDRSARQRGQSGHKGSSPLAGKLFDETGARLTPSHAVKKGKRYRYYVSRPLITGAKDAAGWRVPALQIEALLAAEAGRMLADHTALASMLEAGEIAVAQWNAAFERAAALRHRLLSEISQGEALREVIHRAALRPDSLNLTLSLSGLVEEAGEDALRLEREVPMRIKRRGVEMRLIIESPGTAPAKLDPVLVKELGRAHRCFVALVTGEVANLTELAAREGVSDRYISSLLPLAFLAPSIVEAVMAGRQPPEMTAHKLIRHTELPSEWQKQVAILGF